MKALATALLISLAALNAHAQESPKFRWFGSFGFSFGGDTLASGSYTNGQSFSIKAGDGFLLSGGMSYQVYNKTDLQLSVGYQSTSTNANNGKIEFTRMPIELLGFYEVDSSWRLGGGVRSATGAKLSTSGAAGALGSYEFNPSLGWVLEGQYFFQPINRNRPQYGVNLRLVSESFEEKVSKTKVKGDSIGIGLFAYF